MIFVLKYCFVNRFYFYNDFISNLSISHIYWMIIEIFLQKSILISFGWFVRGALFFHFHTFVNIFKQSLDFILLFLVSNGILIFLLQADKAQEIQLFCLFNRLDEANAIQVIPFIAFIAF